MVKARLTSNCASHRVNPDYVTLLFDFDGRETNVRDLNNRILGIAFNWQPRDDVFRAAVRLLANISPTFRDFIVGLGNYLEFHKPVDVPRVEKSKPITELAELLL
jgi:hypothetical protein